MRYFAPQSSSLIRAIIQVIQLTDSPWIECTNADEASVILIYDDRGCLADTYRANKAFIFLSEKKQRNLAENVVQVSPSNIIGEMPKALEFAKAFKPDVPVLVAFQMPSDLVSTQRRCQVLVIDDKRENLDAAKALLEPRGHQVTVALGFAEGMRHIEMKKFDYVLSDMAMPGNRYYMALSYDAWRLDQTYEYGMGVIFEATSRDMPVAIVTDANHHGNWMSAMLDILKKATVNGKPVLFFNHIGKRWDIALAELEKANSVAG